MQDQNQRHVRAGLVVGIGVAALADGVVFHQILQWHHMLSAWHPPNTAANLHTNTTADRLFDLVALATLWTGLGLMFRTTRASGRRPPARLTFGALLLGVGGFNVVEGVVDHEVLGIHHVREGRSATTYDISFLVISAIVCLVGGVLLRDRGRP